MSERLRVGVDVGGTFTKAVAVEPRLAAVVAQAAVPTSHDAAAGVAEGLVAALELLLARLGSKRARVELVAFSTTQAMNALLEGDVARVGIVGIGEAPDLRAARKRTRVGRIALAPGRELETEHEFLDATGGLEASVVDAALERLLGRGCESIAVSGAFAVDRPEQELLVVEHARARGLPACAGHELTGVYGLETRTVSAAINAGILPIVERTATLVERALEDAGLAVPLLVLRGDGGAMTVDGFRRSPSFTIGSAPAAGVAAAVHALGLGDAIVVECGGTSSNVSVVKNGRPVLRSLRVMGRPTCIRAVDSWVVGAAGGSMIRVGRRSVEETGPRSAHIAGLPYACFASAEEFAAGELEIVAPRIGDPPAYVTVRAASGRYALTATCAANALGQVAEGAYPYGSREAALAAFAPLGRRLRRSPEAVAGQVLAGAARKIAQAVAEAIREHSLPDDAPLVVLGGAGDALLPEVARLLGRPLVRPGHPEILSAVGAALSLIRVEATRSVVGESTSVEAAREAERACVAAGAAPATVAVETTYDRRAGLVRAVATGAVALERGAAGRSPAKPGERLQAAADALAIPSARLSAVAENDFYTVFSGNGDGGVAVVDSFGRVPFAAHAEALIAGEGDAFLRDLHGRVEAASLNLGLATVPPRVTLVYGSHIVDLSDARSPEEIVAAATRAVDASSDGPFAALLVR